MPLSGASRDDRTVGPRPADQQDRLNSGTVTGRESSRARGFRLFREPDCGRTRRGRNRGARSGRSESELLDPAGLNELVAAAAPAAVVNAAGMTSPASARANPSACFAVNAGGALNLLEALRQRAPGRSSCPFPRPRSTPGQRPSTNLQRPRRPRPTPLRSWPWRRSAASTDAATGYR